MCPLFSRSSVSKFGEIFTNSMYNVWKVDSVSKRLYLGSPTVYAYTHINPFYRFSAFIKEKWADGAGELGKHIRTHGGKHAPWLKVRDKTTTWSALRTSRTSKRLEDWFLITTSHEQCRLRHLRDGEPALVTPGWRISDPWDPRRGGSFFFSPIRCLVLLYSVQNEPTLGFFRNDSWRAPCTAGSWLGGRGGHRLVRG